MEATRPSAGTAPRNLYAIFAASGFAALVYQVVWQRSLFAIYGINVESVTVVVTAFMLGLGLGSLAGGRISRAPDRRVLRWFAGIEAAIGAFGAVSVGLFRVVGAATLDWPAWATAVVTFALVLAPTLLMGSTLPLLVAHAVRRSGNVGRSVGALYAVNTLGSAVAALLTAVVLLHFVGQTACARLAALLNAGVALRALRLSRRDATP